MTSKKALTTAEELALVLDKAAELLEELAKEMAQDSASLTDGFDACVEAVDTLRHPGRVLSEPETPSLHTQIQGIRARIEQASQQYVARADILKMISDRLLRVEQAAKRLEDALLKAPAPAFGGWDESSSRGH